MARTRSQKSTSSPLTKGLSSPKVLKVPKSKKSSKKTEVASSPSPSKIKKTADESVLSSGRLLKAVEALEKYAKAASTGSKSDKAQLFDDDDENKLVFVQINTKKFQATKPNFKPKSIKLTHLIHNSKDPGFKVCLILRDQLITSEEELARVEAANLTALNQIVLLDSLKKEYKNFEKRRQFHTEYDMFLVDDALMNLMPTLLGKIFYGKGNLKLPIPIRVTSTSNPKTLSLDTVKNQMEKALLSTAYLLPTGVNVSIKAGSFSGPLSSSDIAENVLDIVSSFELATVKSIVLKTEASPALPLYETETLFGDEDVQKENESPEAKKSTGVSLSAYEKGLLELGDPDEVAKLIGKKMNQTALKERKASSAGKVTKPTKTKTSKKKKVAKRSGR